MVGYPLLLNFLDKILKPKPNAKSEDYEPTVTYMIVAHNEEKVIVEKLENALKLDYPAEKLNILVASDFSTDNTEPLVKDFRDLHKESCIRLYCSIDHKGKTNAQNEAQKLVESEILVMTDANSILKTDAIKRLVECFSADNISYVCGKLVYMNTDSANTADSESTYWNWDLKMRDIESRISTITAGNGALYACRNKDYHDFYPLYCHDASMPPYYAKIGKRAIFAPEAIAYEKAGEVNADEFKRKVRMNRDIVDMIKTGIPFLNVFKYGWMSVFYTGHRTCRYLIWLAHIVALVSTIVMACYGSIFGIVASVLQLFGLVVSLIQIKKSVSNKYLRMLGYYGMTVLAQVVGIWKTINGTNKPVWEKAESTR